MMLKALLPALNLLVLSPSLWVALAAAGGFVFGIYFERKKLYGSLTHTANSDDAGKVPRRDAARRIANSSRRKKKPSASEH